MKETIEEAAAKYAYRELKCGTDKVTMFECINDFIAGTKWQEENNKHIIKILESVHDVTPEHNIYVRGKIIEAIELLKQ